MKPTPTMMAWRLPCAVPIHKDTSPPDYREGRSERLHHHRRDKPRSQTRDVEADDGGNKTEKGNRHPRAIRAARSHRAEQRHPDGNPRHNTPPAHHQQTACDPCSRHKPGEQPDDAPEDQSNAAVRIHWRHEPEKPAAQHDADEDHPRPKLHKTRRRKLHPKRATPRALPRLR